METPTLTPRTSLTLSAHHVTSRDEKESLEAPHLSPALEQELQRDELAIETYGGNQPAEPEDRHSIVEDVKAVTWDGPDDPENPQNWSNKYKWWIAILCSLMTVNVTFASSAPAVTAPYIVKEYGVSKTVSYLIVSLFLFGYATGPILWGSTTEVYVSYWSTFDSNLSSTGRRPIMCITMVSYWLLILGQAIPSSITTLLVTRFLSGVFAVAPMIISGGIIADVFDAAGRGAAASLFTLCVFLGPVLGPIISSIVVSSDGVEWRWVYWVMFIFSGVAAAFVAVFLLPETYAPVILQKKAVRMRKAHAAAGTTPKTEIFAEHERQSFEIKEILNRTLYRPFIMLFKEPILLLVTVYLSLVYGLLYALFQTFPLIFMGVHGFTMVQSGLVFIGVGIGTTSASFANIYFNRIYPKLIIRWRGFPPPEYRLIGGMWGGPLLVIGILWLGWTGHYESVHWVVPALSSIVIGFSISIIFISFSSYLIDTYLMYAASALAASTIIRSFVGAAFPLFITEFFKALGIRWAATILAGAGLILAPSPFFFYKYGARIRERSKFAPCLDLKIAKELAAQENKSTDNEKNV